MAARVKISMSPEEYLAGLRNLEAETQKSANKMENSFKQYGTSINKAGIAMRYVSAEMGAGAVAFGRAFQVLAGGKIAVAVAAIAGAFVGLKKIWDELTVSSEEYKNRLNAQVEANDKNIDSMRKSQTEEDAMLERLQELAKRENKTVEEKEEQIKLAEILAGKYGKLGVSVNDLTEDYESLFKAIKKIDDIQVAERTDALANQIKLIEKSVDEEAKKNIVGGFGSQAWDFLKRFGRGVSSEDRYNYYQSLSAEDKLGYAQFMLNPENQFGARTDSDISFWKSQVSELEKLVDLTKRLNTLREAGVETQKEQLNKIATKTDSARKSADEELAEIERLANAEAARERDADKEREKALQKEREAYAERLNMEEQLAKANKKRLDDQRVSLRFMAMNALGMNKQAAVDEALFNEANARGTSVAALDPETVKTINQNTLDRLALQEAMQTSTSAEMYAPRVNSLIARGGSAAPVKMPKVEELQSKQLSVLEKTSIIASQILRNTEDWNTI
jgi:hypothetical protein